MSFWSFRLNNEQFLVKKGRFRCENSRLKCKTEQFRSKTAMIGIKRPFLFEKIKFRTIKNDF